MQPLFPPIVPISNFQQALLFVAGRRLWLTFISLFFSIVLEFSSSKVAEAPSPLKLIGQPPFRLASGIGAFFFPRSLAWCRSVSVGFCWFHPIDAG